MRVVRLALALWRMLAGIFTRGWRCAGWRTYTHTHTQKEDMIALHKQRNQ